MFGELPKLFGRDFALGFLLPVAVFGFASLVLLEEFGVLTSSLLPLLLETEEAILVSVFVVALWLAGILLLALNRSIIRLKEGYGKLNPARPFGFVERNRYRKLVARAEGVAADLALAKSRGEERNPTLVKKQNELRLRLATEYPHIERFVLPTAFGNTIRAFEAYSAVMYGLDAIPSWPRLLMVMPENDRGLVDVAKAQVDFWVSLWFLNLVFLVEYLILMLVTGRPGAPWAWVAVPLAWIASSRARDAAMLWGETVKAAFDVYVPELRKRIGLEPFATPEQEREQWTNMSKAMIYRNPKRLPPRGAQESDTEERQPGFLKLIAELIGLCKRRAPRKDPKG